MNTFRVNALAVREMNRVIGTISRQIVDGAIFMVYRIEVCVNLW